MSGAIDLGAFDATERLSADDLATHTEHQHLQAALAQQRAAAAKSPRAVPGTCSNCGGACLPQAVYCDEHCRADHHHRETVHARQHGASPRR